MVNKMQENKNYGVVYGNYYKFGAEKKLVNVEIGNIGHFLAGCNMSVTSLIRKDLFIKVGGFAEYMRNGFEDLELFVKLIQSCEFAKVDKVIFNYRILKNSRNKQAMQKRNEVFLNIIRNNKKIYSDNLEEFYLEITKEKEKLYEKIKKLNKKRRLLIKALIATILTALTLFAIQWVKH
jgi:hypothetical protein